MTEKTWNKLKNRIDENFPTVKSIIKSCRTLKKTTNLQIP